MSYHQSFAALLTATAVIVVGYRAGRTHASWRAVRDARRTARATRRAAWVHTAQFLTGTIVLLVTLFIAAYDAGR